MPKIYILLPVHNRREVTRAFVEFLRNQTFSNYHLILVDDGSRDGTSQMVEERIPSLTVLRGIGKWWWAGSLQQGLNWLRKNKIDDSALVLFINDDVKFSSTYLESAVRIMQDKKRTIVLSKFLNETTGNIEETGVSADLKKMTFSIVRPGEVINCLSTRGLFAYWKDVKEIGGFYPCALPHYMSDYEYTIRAYRKGFKLETADDLLIVPNHETTGLHKIESAGLCDYLGKMFSKRSPNNPLYRSVFIFLTSPPLWILPNLIHLWHAVLRTMAVQVIRK